MTDYKSYLKIGKPETDNPMGLFRYRYEIIHSEYSFSQEMNAQGQVTSDIKGETIQVALPTVPTERLINWMLNPDLYENGEIVLYNGEEVVNKIYFSDARCIKLHIHYQPLGPSSIITQLSINAQHIEVGDINYDNSWKKK